MSEAVVLEGIKEYTRRPEEREKVDLGACVRERRGRGGKKRKKEGVGWGNGKIIRRLGPTPSGRGQTGVPTQSEKKGVYCCCANKKKIIVSQERRLAAVP